jgi:hypothetical protein
VRIKSSIEIMEMVISPPVVGFEPNPTRGDYWGSTPTRYDLDVDLANTNWFMTTLLLFVVVPILSLFL